MDDGCAYSFCFIAPQGPPEHFSFPDSLIFTLSGESMLDILPLFCDIDMHRFPDMAKSNRKWNSAPEAPEETTPQNVECKIIRLGFEKTDRSNGDTHLIGVLQALKRESESLLSLMESHQELSGQGWIEQDGIGR